MNIQQLSKRLETVVSYIPKQSKIADIGSDHAYLPCYAVNKGIASSAIAGEVVKGPFLSAKKQVEDAQLTKEVEVRLGNGLEVIAPGEVECITIAGMGGTLIASILEAGKDKLTNDPRLILQPNVSARSIRTWLMDNEWDLIGEEILEEDDKLYEILIAEKGNPKSHYSKDIEKELLLGPFLMKEKNAAFIKKWNQELHQWKNILNNMERAEKTEALEQRKNELNKKIKMVEEVLNP
ncbi:MULTISPECIES: tRNA (adenine(22)-N(1))-methyltransferase [Bacillaceae]|uniref:tRNA (adenine(22)-N(1))-methyltransferase n=1 Tax=Bacillaceae TaxID=186817 RepID=UPI001C5A215C|nr:tRNA (adenine(22)-N(1))-methyltransferase TrmK [Rossellomorea sp. YZS02]MBW3114301.1 tRNA (adenine(22)-N(1))-methyltransferase TrmK [Bacillus sp. MCCB 382]MDX8341865.1 tRNA (adenine(22)-N(1))-methyltransferase TrmK [Rossellomorea sp. YZS02]